MIPDSYSFLRYLKSKKSVDDRALNRNVWDCMAREIAYLPPGDRLKVFEVGAGIGTMLTRMIEWELFQSAEYTGIDYQQENIAQLFKLTLPRRKRNFVGIFSLVTSRTICIGIPHEIINCVVLLISYFSIYPSLIYPAS